jgi:hypothetical protein
VRLCPVTLAVSTPFGRGIAVRPGVRRQGRVATEVSGSSDAHALHFLRRQECLVAAGSGRRLGRAKPYPRNPSSVRVTYRRRSTSRAPAAVCFTWNIVVEGMRFTRGANPILRPRGAVLEQGAFRGNSDTARIAFGGLSRFDENLIPVAVVQTEAKESFYS